MAMEMPKNPPNSKASPELYKVPQISGSTPKLPLFTSQVVEVMKLRPYCCMAGTAFPPISTTIYTTKTMVSAANTSVNRRNSRSAATSRDDGGLEIEEVVTLSPHNPVLASRSVADTAMAAPPTEYCGAL